MRKKRNVRQPSRNVRRCGPRVRRPSGDRVIGISLDAFAEQTGLDDHFSRELHPGALQLETIEHPAGEAAHAAVDVMHRLSEHRPRHQGECGIAKPPVEPRHRSRQHRAAAGRKAAALDEFAAPSQFLDESGHVTEVVTVVRIAHDDVTSMRRADTAHQRVSIATQRNGNHTGAQCLGQLYRAVGAAVVRNDHFPRNTRLLQRRKRLLDARPNCLMLVQAGHDDGYLDGRVVRGIRASRQSCAWLGVMSMGYARTSSKRTIRRAFIGMCARTRIVRRTAARPAHVPPSL